MWYQTSAHGSGVVHGVQHVTRLISQNGFIIVKVCAGVRSCWGTSPEASGLGEWKKKYSMPTVLMCRQTLNFAQSSVPRMKSRLAAHREERDCHLTSPEEARYVLSGQADPVQGMELLGVVALAVFRSTLD